MSRNLKRVPLDFDWPLKKIWGGYLNPFYGQSTKCHHCEGSGYSPKAKLFSDQWYGCAPFDPVAYGAKPLTIDHPAIEALARRNVERELNFYVTQYHRTGSHVSKGAVETAIFLEKQRLFDHWKGQWSHHLIQADVDALVEADRLWAFTRVPLNDEQKANCWENGWTKEPNGRRPTAEEVNDWSFVGIGHDSINQHVCIEARCKREGVPVTCERCDGEGKLWPSPEIKQACEDWEATDPPTGEGYQLWEDCSEGSPVSPVFATLDELCAWCETGATTFADFKVSAAEWKQMLEKDHVYHQNDNMIFM